MGHMTHPTAGGSTVTWRRDSVTPLGHWSCAGCECWAEGSDAAAQSHAAACWRR